MMEHQEPDLSELTVPSTFFDPDSKIPGEMFMGGWRCMGTNSKGEKWIYFNRSNKGKDKGKAVIHKGNVAITVTPRAVL